MSLVIVAVFLAVVVLGVARAIFPLHDPVIELLRAVIICIGSMLWPILLPIVVMVGVVWGASTLVNKLILKVRR